MANLIKILIVNFHYDLIMPNTDCAVILQKIYLLTKQQKKEGHMDIFCIIIYWCLRDCYVWLSLFLFFSSCFMKL